MTTRTTNSAYESLDCKGCRDAQAKTATTGLDYICTAHRDEMLSA